MASYIKPLFFLPLLVSPLVRCLCNDEQQSICLDKYYRSTSFWFPSNELKECKQKPYAEFSHVCTVDDYLPNVDHCCCSVPRVPATNKHYKEGSSDKVVLCCRYHQDWNKFRCLLDKDLIDPNSFSIESQYSVIHRYPYNLFFYIFFVIITIILIVIIIHLFKKANRNKRIYKQASQNPRAFDRARNNPIVHSSGLPPYTEKFDDMSNRSHTSNNHISSLPTAPPANELSNGRGFQIDSDRMDSLGETPSYPPPNVPRKESPPPPYDRISNIQKNL